MSDQAPATHYPSRPSEDIDHHIRTISELLDGTEAVFMLTDNDRQAILDVEASLAEDLKAITKLSPRSFSIELGYLITEAGRSELYEATGIQCEEQAAANEKLLYAHTETLERTSQAKLDLLSGHSVQAYEEAAFNAARTSGDTRETIDPTAIPTRHDVTVRLTPTLDADKHQKLHHIRERIISLRDTSQYQNTPDTKSFYHGILDLYQRKINELLANTASVEIAIRKKADLLGAEALSESEQVIYNDRDHSGYDRTLARYDKFIHGADESDDYQAWHQQISNNLSTYAQAQAHTYQTEQQNFFRNVRAQNLNVDDVNEAHIPAETVAAVCEYVLRSYELLSEEPAETYTSDRSGAAADGKWQFVMDDAYRSMVVDGAQKVIKCPNQAQSFIRLISITIAHEIEGHVLQNENKKQIPLKLFNIAGADRSSVFAEAGAMFNQNLISETLFGFRTVSHPHYVFAMLTKLSGGTYADCVQSFYESAVIAPTQMYENGDITDAAYQAQCDEQLRTALNRTERLFRGGADTEEPYPFLSNSKDTVYVEQARLGAQLQTAGLTKLLFLTKVNLEAIEFLLRADMLHLDDMQTPHYVAKQLWEAVADTLREQGGEAGAAALHNYVTT